MKDPKDTETGVANAAGVVPGQRLLEIDIALPDPRQLKLIRRVGRWEGEKVGREKDHRMVGGANHIQNGKVLGFQSTMSIHFLL